LANNRLEIEKSILGDCISEGRYLEIAHILTAKNFTNHHQQVWLALTHMYPNQAVDLVTLTHYMNQRWSQPGDATWAYVLTDLTMHHAYSRLGQYIMILIQLDMTKHYTEQLEQIRDSYIKAGNPHKADICKGMLEELPTVDLVTEHKLVNGYLSEQGITMPELDRFADQLDQKVAQMKKTNQMAALSAHLSRLARLGDDQGEAIGALLDIVAQVIFSDRRLKPSEINQIEAIKSETLDVIQ